LASAKIIKAEIHPARDRKLEEARHQPHLPRARIVACTILERDYNDFAGETEAGSAGMQPC